MLVFLGGMQGEGYKAALPGKPAVSDCVNLAACPPNNLLIANGFDTTMIPVICANLRFLVIGAGRCLRTIIGDVC
jgi:hypothetical protein